MIRDAVIVVSEHAKVRWRQRVRHGLSCPADEIREAVRGASLLGKGDLLPRGVTRFPGQSYAINGGAFFVLDPLDRGVFKVVTVLSIGGAP